MIAPQVKNQKPSVSVKDEKTFAKEEHQLIYCAFLDTLEKPEKQTQQEIEKIEKELQKKPSEQKEQELQSDLKSLKERLPRLQDENEKKIFTFIFENHKKIFNNVNIEPKDIKLLSEENFCQFLLSILKKIREKKLANEEKLNNDKIQQIITKCVADIRGTEAKDSLIKLAGWPFGIKIDPKNISSSFMNGVKEKIPFLGKDKKEEDEPPLSDEEMVTTFLRKSLFPIIALTTVILLGGLSGPVSVFGLFTIPHVIVIGFAVFGFAAAEYKAVKSLFSNDKKGTLYNPDSQDEKQRKEWDKEISDGISKILETSGKGAGKGEQPTEEQLTQKSEQSTMLEQVTLEQLAENIEKQPSKT